MKLNPVLLLFLFLLVVPLASGKDIFVNAAATSGDNNGTDWANGFLKLQDALEAAQSGDTVLVAEGIYYPDEGQSMTADSHFHSFVLPKSSLLLGGYRSDGAVRNPHSFPTILSGDIEQNDVNTDGNQIAESTNDLAGRNTLHVLQTSSDCEIDGFIITAGEATFDATEGGGLLATEDDVVVRHCHFQGNLCSGRGGAAMIDGTNTEFIHCLFTGNRSNSRGGALASLSAATPAVTNCLFSGNLAERGGAMNFNATSATLTNCTISGNAGSINGGGIQAEVNSLVTLRNTIIWNNHAVGLSALGGSSLNMLSGSSYATTTCLIANEGGSDPLFVLPSDPALAPSSLGNLALMIGSPAIDAGTLEFNEQPFDIVGRQRIFAGSIDLGAHEVTTEIFVNATATNGNNDGSSWKDGYLHLQDALTEAVSGDFVNIAAGVYYPDEGVGAIDNDRESTFEVQGGVEVRGGYPAGGGLRNLSQHVTILSGDLAQDDLNTDGNDLIEDVTQIVGHNAYSVVSAGFSSEAVTLSGLTITAGLANTVDNFSGGGIRIRNNPLRLHDCWIVGNRAANSGAGLQFNSASRPLEVLRCQFLSNAAIATAEITSSSGAGLSSISNEVVLSDCLFEGNSTFGGVTSFATAFSARGSNSNSSCLIERTLVRSNTSNPLSGSAIANVQDFDSAILTGCSFLGNDTEQGSFSRVLTLVQNPDTQVRDCIFAGNRAFATVYFFGTVSTVPNALSFQNCTMAGNEGVSFFRPSNATPCSLTLHNCVIDQPFADTAGLTLSRSHSLIAGRPADGNGNLPDTTVPGFMNPLPASSAPTLAGDYRLLPTSALVDAGLNSLTSSATDLSGLPRLVDGDGNGTATVDIGAHESQQSPPSPELEISAIAYNPNNGQVTLTVESSRASSFTAQCSVTLLPGQWGTAQTGSLTVGTNIVVISGTSYSWPLEKVFFRIVSP